MAFLFQSNPDQWDLRRYFVPGRSAAWFVSRYQSLLYPGALVLLWEAQGSAGRAVRGLYGWGITTAGPAADERGKLRVPLLYVERWVRAGELDSPPTEQHAPVMANDLLALPAWSDHLLATLPSGTNFLVTEPQLRELAELLRDRLDPQSNFHAALQLNIAGTPIAPEQFSAQLLMMKQEAAHASP